MGYVSSYLFTGLYDALANFRRPKQPTLKATFFHSWVWRGFTTVLMILILYHGILICKLKPPRRRLPSPIYFEMELPIMVVRQFQHGYWLLRTSDIFSYIQVIEKPDTMKSADSHYHP